MDRYEQGFVKRAMAHGLDENQSVALLAAHLEKKAQMGQAFRILGKAVAGRAAKPLAQVASRIGSNGLATRLGTYAGRNNAGIRAGLRSAGGSFMNSRIMQLLTGRNVKGMEKLIAQNARKDPARAISAFRDWGRTGINAKRQALDAGKGFLNKADRAAMRAFHKSNFGAMQGALSSGVMPGAGSAKDALRAAYAHELNAVRNARLGVGAGLGALGLGGMYAATRDRGFGNSSTSSGKGSYRDYFG